MLFIVLIFRRLSKFCIRKESKGTNYYLLITKIERSDFEISKIIFLYFFRQKFNIENIGCLSYILH